MERRDFLKGLSAAGLLSMLDPAYLSAKERFQSGETPTDPVPKRQYGRAKDMLSVIGFGGIVVKDVTPEDASNYVSEAVDRGINYFDVAPTYGNAQERLGPALKPYRDKCFLACKTQKRDAKGAQEELEESFRLLQTDHFDLYQLHAITTLEDVETSLRQGRGHGDIPEGEGAGQGPLPRLLGPQRSCRSCGPGPLRFRFHPVSAQLPDLDQGRLRAFCPQTSTERQSRHPCTQGDGPSEMAEADEARRAALEEDVVRAIRRHRQGVARAAVHFPFTSPRHDPARPLGVVQDGRRVGSVGGTDAAE